MCALRLNTMPSIKMFKWTTAVLITAILLAGGLTYFRYRSVSTTPLSDSDLLLTVNRSESTNTLPYSIMIFMDGSATVSVEGRATENFKPGSVDAKTLKTLLQNVGDVSQLTRRQHCVKPASFGTITWITYNGKTSGDIFCPGTHWPQAGYDLSNFIRQIRLPVRSSRFGR